MPTDAEIIADLKGQLEGYKKQVQTVTEQVAHAVAAKEELEKAMPSKIAEAIKAQKERDSLENEAHAIAKDMDLSKMKDEEIKGFISGYKKALESKGTKEGHGVPPPKANAGTTDPKPAISNVDAFLKK